MATSSIGQPIPATLIPGDGIGPEISAAVVAILDALGRPFVWETQEGGMSAVREFGDPLPAALLDSIRRTKLALKGPLTTPVGGGFRSVNVRLREEFRLYANLRPARTLIAGGRYEDIDLVLVARTSRASTSVSSITSRSTAIRTRSRLRPASTRVPARAASPSSLSIMHSRIGARRSRSCTKPTC